MMRLISFASLLVPLSIPVLESNLVVGTDNLQGITTFPFLNKRIYREEHYPLY